MEDLLQHERIAPMGSRLCGNLDLDRRPKHREQPKLVRGTTARGGRATGGRLLDNVRTVPLVQFTLPMSPVIATRSPSQGEYATSE